MVSKKISLILGASIALGALLYAYQKLKPQSIKIAEIGVPSGTVTLTLNAPSPNLPLNQDATITLSYSSPTEKLTAIQVEFTYDPSYLTINNVTPSPAFGTVLQPPIIQNGKISFAYGITPDSNGLIGTGIVATFSARALQLGSTSLSYTSNTLASTIERNDNALLTVANPTFTIIDLSPSPSVSPSPPPTSPSPSTLPSPSLTNKPGDLNNDGVVNFIDFNELITYFGTTYNLGHFNDLITNFGQ